MSAARRLGKTLRAWGPANRSVTGLARAIFGRRAPEFVVSHLPRQGVVEVALPGGEELRMWSAGDDWITSRLWWRGLSGYEPEMVMPFLRFAESARTVLDVGAFVGFYALVAARSNAGARVFAFEPNPDLAARLGRNVSLNPGLRVTVLPYAAAAGRGPLEFHLGGDWLPSSSGISADNFRSVVTMPSASIDLDSFVLEWGLSGTVDLVKIDVETAEADVLEGMRQTLARDRPVIFCEVLPEGVPERIEKVLEGADYALFHLRAEGAVAESRLEPHAEYLNHLLCPAEKVPGWLRSGGR